jgi:hypothetical protein
VNHFSLIQPAHDRAELLTTAATVTDAGDEFVVATDLPRELRTLTGMQCPLSARQLVTMASNELPRSTTDRCTLRGHSRSR